MRIVKCRRREVDDFGPHFVYCGREWGGYAESPLANNASRSRTPGVAAAAFRVWLWQQLQSSNASVLEAINALTEESVLGCWCVDNDDAATETHCHCGVTSRAWAWLRAK